MKNSTIIIVTSLLLTYNCQVIKMNNMILSSNSFDNEGFVPKEYSCEGQDFSPHFKWENIPTGTVSFALTCIDPDAPMGDWIHWIAWNIPADWDALQKNIDPNDQSQIVQGTNSWGRTGYGGPCPPVGHGPHRYYFTIYALDTKLSLESTSRLEDLVSAMKGHILGKGEIMGKYERN